ncbi:MAG: permease [Candidatus Omnitrophica bacterium]|nr:permease [Candidatus Omnitrophota bacterium]MDD5574725.1 permease [Candidatus Omnitrophota bacterium]
MARDPICGMPVDEKHGLRLGFEGETFFFCSRACLEKFAKSRGLSSSQPACAPAFPSPFYVNKTFIVASALGLLLAVSAVVDALVPFRIVFLKYLETIWFAVLAGLFLGGLIDHFVPREYISKVLASRKRRTIFYSVILGFFMSACSHGILALAIELHKKGASNPAVVAFLLASPWANMAITIMLFAFFGTKALFILCSAIVIALTTGFVFQGLDGMGWIEKNEHIVATGKDFSIAADVKKRCLDYRPSRKAVLEDARGVLAGAVSLGDMVLWWIMIGMGIASFAGAYIPPEAFQKFAGPTVLGLFVTLAVATVIEVCSEGSAPMAFEIFRQTGAVGNSFVFLMAGVVTDYTEIGLLWHNVGRRVAVWLPIVAVPQVVVLGILANAFLK